VIPEGGPQTGEGGAANSAGHGELLAVGFAALIGAGAAAGGGISRRRRRPAVGFGPDDADAGEGQRSGDE
jgi:hypothetical protein